MAWEKARSNKGAGWIDNETIATFEFKKEIELQNLYEELRTGEYKPLPVKRIYIDTREIRVKDTSREN